MLSGRGGVWGSGGREVGGLRGYYTEEGTGETRRPIGAIRACAIDVIGWGIDS